MSGVNFAFYAQKTQLIKKKKKNQTHPQNKQRASPFRLAVLF